MLENQVQQLRTFPPGGRMMEEFSFPAMAEEKDMFCQLQLPHFASSPLWLLSSNSNQHGNLQRSRSFSSVEGMKLQEKSFTEANDEEKMDMLWENFNEEIHQIPCDGEIVGKNVSESSRASTELGDKWKGGGELFCVKAVHQRRPGLMMVLKVFKNLLLIQKLRRTRKASTYHK